ncbi:MAG: DUF1353 domain-containing protein [Rhodopseudomonas palustris]|uniref:DUF1353 domain-containing protein n=1 Tax=Rhodopseudomonas palustris TaxID=1076 RepID=A0A933RVQ6_RHOPL|nr:DUF1353 domain-containing protein [Rhodopseudomonas palustris]
MAAPMKLTMLIALGLAILFAGEARAEFIGRLAFAPPDCRSAGQCDLVYDFGYIDPRGIGWQAKAGLKTDGASIPPWAQPIIGGPWEAQYLRAAVIHDHYCKRTVRSRTSTHRMFYDALIESGVTRVKALVMYYAVMVGSHMWINLMEGRPCSAMQNCIQNVDATRVIPGSTIRKNETNELQAYRPSRFDDPTVVRDIAEAQVIIEGGSITSPEAVEQLARHRNASDFYLIHGDSIAYQGPTSTLQDR